MHKGHLALIATIALSTITSGNANRQVRTNRELYHPGHPPVHVTRLHRYEHDGIDSMLEKEARWHGQGTSSPSRGFLQTKRHTLGKPVQGFVPVSEQQAAALRRHHEEHFASLLQVNEEIGMAEGIINIGHGEGSSFLRYHDQTHGEGDVAAVTALSNLYSQYVGPVGVGSIEVGAGCNEKTGGSLEFISYEEAQKKIETQSGSVSVSHSESTSVTVKKVEKSSSAAEISGSRGDTDGGSCWVTVQSLVWVVFDTGSTNIWVNSDLCVSGACAGPERKRYNHLLSKTYHEAVKSMVLSIEFGTGKIRGVQVVDDFHIGPFTVFNQTFGMIKEQDGQVFVEVAFEGILGLAFPLMSANGVTPFFDNIVNQKALANNEFSFYFSLNNPSANCVLWGGVDKTFYQGDIMYFPVVDPYYWSIGMSGFKLGDEDLLHMLDEEVGEDSRSAGATPGFKVIVDTGTTYFTAQGKLFAFLMERLPAAPCKSLSDATHPPLTWILIAADGRHVLFRLVFSQYMIASGSGGDDQRCSPAFMKIPIPKKHGPALVLGEVFLRHYYSVFDRNTDVSKARIGFAPSKHEDGSNIIAQRILETTHRQETFEEAH